MKSLLNMAIIYMDQVEVTLKSLMILTSNFHNKPKMKYLLSMMKIIHMDQQEQLQSIQLIYMSIQVPFMKTSSMKNTSLMMSMNKSILSLKTSLTSSPMVKDDSPCQ